MLEEYKKKLLLIDPVLLILMEQTQLQLIVISSKMTNFQWKKGRDPIFMIL